MNSFALILLLAIAPVSQKAASTPERDAAVRDIIKNELAFAKKCGEVGIRDSFLEYFADDAISFAPAPGNAKERLKARPATGKGPASLEWAPTYADAARSGDLGYDFGPSKFTDPRDSNRGPYWGYFFSVWKKQHDGAWKVVADIGASTPTPPNQEFTLALPGPPSAYAAKSPADPNSESANLMQTDRAFSRKSASDGPASAYRVYGEPNDVRLHRAEHFAIVGSAAVAAYWADQKTTFIWDPLYADVSAAGDIGYTYG